MIEVKVGKKYLQKNTHIEVLVIEYLGQLKQKHYLVKNTDSGFQFTMPQDMFENEVE